MEGTSLTSTSSATVGIVRPRIGPLRHGPDIFQFSFGPNAISNGVGVELVEVKLELFHDLVVRV
jgi:hypothetical protein